MRGHGMGGGWAVGACSSSLLCSTIHSSGCELSMIQAVRQEAVTLRGCAGFGLLLHCCWLVTHVMRCAVTGCTLQGEHSHPAPTALKPSRFRPKATANSPRADDKVRECLAVSVRGSRKLTQAGSASKLQSTAGCAQSSRQAPWKGSCLAVVQLP